MLVSEPRSPMRSYWQSIVFPVGRVSISRTGDIDTYSADGVGAPPRDPGAHGATGTWASLITAGPLPLSGTRSRDEAPDATSS